MVRIISDFVECNFAKTPGKILFAQDDCAVTVGEYRRQARNIATLIIGRGCFKTPIAIYMDKSVNCLTAFMGVAYSGNFYTPIDTEMPVQRVKAIFDVLSPAIIITDQKHKEKIESLTKDIFVVCYESAVSTAADESAVNMVGDRIIDTDAAYILFTSGSTGTPKGVVVSHKSVISYATWVTETFGINKDTVFGNQTPFYFSMSVLEIFATLKVCGTMHIIPKALFSFPVRLLDYIKEREINTIYWVPSALCQVANLRALGTRDISCIKKVLFAGEVMPAKQLNMWIKELPDAMFANLFGPTEATDISNFYVVNRELADDEAVPIGNACRNTDVFILDGNGKAIEEKNVTGELCIRGSTLAYGYYNNLEKTKEVFTQNPLNPYYPEIIYKTGDLVHINEYGELIYEGRKDFQIKHMGHRIELGEIETAISSLEGIAANCCIYDKEKKEIVLFYEGRIDDGSAIGYIRDKVPVYMMPGRVVKIGRLPLNSNGKMDRNALMERYRNGKFD